MNEAPPTLAEALAAAIEQHRAGRLAAAEEIYRRILAVAPREPAPWHLLGVVARQTGRLELAVQYGSRAVELNGHEADYRHDLGESYRVLGRIPEAVECFQQALNLRPAFSEALNGLAICLRKQGRLEEAATCSRAAIDARPDFAYAYNTLGLTLNAQSAWSEAAAVFRRALELKPDFPEALNNLGLALDGCGQDTEALDCFRRALELQPAFLEALINRGAALERRGSIDEAATCFQRAIDIRPDQALAYAHLGVLRQRAGDLDEAARLFQLALERDPHCVEALDIVGDACLNRGSYPEAIDCCRRALQLRPDHFRAWNNLGLAHLSLGQLGEAVDCLDRALQAAPRSAEVLVNLGLAYLDQGLWEEAIDSYRKSLELQPDLAVAHSNFLMALQYKPSITPRELLAAHRTFDERFGRPLRASWPAHDNDRDPHRRLRLGFVSSDFGAHPVGRFLVQALEHLDRRAAEAVCYNGRIANDALTARIQARADAWRNVAAVDDAHLAEQIRADRVDILFDLAGHTGRNRMLTLARKPAPLQIAWIGYEGTTGLAAMDYLLADRYEVPAEAEPAFVERILRLPDGYLCYDPPADAPDVAPLPALTRGHVTLGSFNYPPKIHSGVVELWVRIMNRLPASRLVLTYRGLDDPAVARRLSAAFAAQGVDPGRLELRPMLSHAELLRSYGEIDVALDPFPFAGSATTCDALWMGVPVITCPGVTFASRHGLSHLSTIGLTETIAADHAQYVEIAVGLAGDLPRLAALRARLRSQMARSPLCDGPRFAQNLLAVLREVWHQWCGARG